ncbi:MAG: hypothetical protein WAX67_02275 [Rugosibacter sp.]
MLLEQRPAAEVVGTGLLLAASITRSHAASDIFTGIRRVDVQACT